MTIEYIAYQMVAGLKGGDGKKPDPKIAALLDAYDFYIIPFANPDGFVYSQEEDRLWRKNRTPPPPDANNQVSFDPSSNPIDIPDVLQSCYGVDVNRNWPYKWKAGDPAIGSWSPNPCSEVYHGESPGDAPENQGLVALVNKIAARQNIKFYADWHSYGQYILTPYGYNCNLYPANSAEQVDLAGKSHSIFLLELYLMLIVLRKQVR
jgi:murein tripeptide amidase MpaA